MVSRQEKQKWIIENCTNKKGEIDLSKLNFGKRKVLLNGIKTKGNINNDKQKAHYITNYYQEAYEIDNFGQKVEWKINNSFQEAQNIIRNYNQKAQYIYNKEQIANQIDNSSQEAKETIINKQQKTYEIDNTLQKANIEYWNKTKK